MSKPTVDWDALTPTEKRELMDEGREACDREMRVLLEARDGGPKKPGPKPKAMTLTAADLERAD